MLSPQKTLLIPGLAGELEILPVDAASKKTAIICHPHPLQGGTMTNKVVTTLARTFAECECNTVRFNFRGVGKSTGEYDDGRGELEDLKTVVAWAEKHFQKNEKNALWLAGFSFGGWIAAKGALQLSPQKLITVAPMFARLQKENLEDLKTDWILAQGEQDELLSAEALFAWVEQLSHPPRVLRFPETGHFFHGKLGMLRERLRAVLCGE